MTAAHAAIIRVASVALALAGVACSRAADEKAADSAVAETAMAAPPAPAAGTPPAPDTTSPPSRPSQPPSRDSAPSRGPGAVPRPTPTPLPAEDVMIGEVVAGGLADSPVTSLRVEGRGPVTLVGPLEAELRRLGGATVSVTGGLAPSPPNAFTVSRYDIVAVDGVRPTVGVLVSRGGSLWIAAADTVRLASVPAALEGKAGAKVWIVGRRTGAELTVQSYGIVRDPAPR